jgi:hypothetical protein
MFSYRVGICNKCRLNGRILRFCGVRAALNALMRRPRYAAGWRLGLVPLSSALEIDHAYRFFMLDSRRVFSHDRSSSHLLRGKSREPVFCLPAVSAALQIS